MANHKGSEGLVKIGANTIAELDEWSVDETADTIDDSELSDTAKTFVADMTSWVASITCKWDETDTTGQGAMTIGSEVSIVFYPEGDVSTDVTRTGTAIITGKSQSGSKGSMVMQSFSLQGNGALVDGAVV